MGIVLSPILSATAGTSRAYNPGIADTYSWIPVEGEALGRPLYAKASYITNFSDMSIHLSASELSIGAVTIKDNNSGLNADVVSIPDYGAGLQVLTQDLQSDIDDITIGDKGGVNYATIRPDTSSLNVNVTNLSSNAVYVRSSQTYPNVVEYRDTAQIAPFGRLRVANPYTVFDTKSLFDRTSRFFWNSVYSNGGETFNDNDASITLSVSGANGYAISETYRRFPYQPGKGQQVLFTGILSAEPNIIKRYGAFSSLSGDNFFQRPIGIYFQSLSSVNTPDPKQQYAWVINNSSLQSNLPSLMPPQSATQAEWNLDKMDGTGPSGITIDFTKSQIFIFDYQWLGVGRVRCGFNYNGRTYYCHHFDHGNKLTGTYMRTPNLPLRAEVRAINGATSGSMKKICASVISEGEADPVNVTRSCSLSAGINPGGIGQANRKAILGIRLRIDRLNATNRVLDVETVPILANASDIGTYRWELVLRPQNMSPAPTWFPISDSSNIEFGFDGTAGSTFTGGEVVATGFASSNSNINLSSPQFEKVLSLGTSLTQVRDELWLVITPLSKTFNFWASFTVAEAD